MSEARKDRLNVNDIDKYSQEYIHWTGHEISVRVLIRAILHVCPGDIRRNPGRTHPLLISRGVSKGDFIE